VRRKKKTLKIKVLNRIKKGKQKRVEVRNAMFVIYRSR